MRKPALLSALALVLAGCGGSNGSSPTSNPVDHPFGLRSLALSTNHLVYDAKHGRLLASLNEPNDGATAVAQIDPNAGSVVRNIEAGSGPDALALSDDGSTLYVGVNGENAVARVSLSSNRRVSSFSLKPVEGSGLPVARDLAVAPGRPSRVAVSIGDPQSSRAVSAAVFDGGVLRPNVAERFGGYDLAFTSASRLLAFDSQTTGAAFADFAVDDSGLTLTSVGRRGGVNGSNDLQLFDGRLYLSDTNVLDAGTFDNLGKFPFPDAVVRIGPAVDLASRRAYFIEIDSDDAPILHVYDLDTFVQTTQVALPAIPGGRKTAILDDPDLTLSGPHTLAFRTADRVYFIDKVPTD